MQQCFPFNQSESSSDPKFLKRITVRFQSKSNKIECSPCPVHSNAHLCHQVLGSTSGFSTDQNIMQGMKVSTTTYFQVSFN